MACSVSDCFFESRKITWWSGFDCDVVTFVLELTFLNLRVDMAATVAAASPRVVELAAPASERCICVAHLYSCLL